MSIARKVLSCVRTCAAIILAAGVTGAPLPSPAVDPYEINAIVPQTGPTALIGRSYTTTLNVVADIVNRTGGIRGRALKFVIIDGQANPQIAVEFANGMIAHGASLFIGPASTSDCAAVMPLLKNGPVMLCTSPAISPPAGSYAFALGIPTLASMQVLARYFQARGWHKIGILLTTDATGQDAERVLDRSVGETAGEAIVDREYFNPTDISISAQATRLRASGAQVIVAWTLGTPFATAMRGLHDAGIDVPIAVSNGSLIYSQLADLHSYLPDNLYFIGIPSAASVAQLPRGPMKTAQQAYIDAFDAVGIRPEIGQDQMWDGAWLAIDAVRKLGFDATAAQVRSYLANLRGWVGIRGTYDFQQFPARGIGGSSLAVARWDPGKNDWVTVSMPGGVPLK